MLKTEFYVRIKGKFVGMDFVSRPVEYSRIHFGKKHCRRWIVGMKKLKKIIQFLVNPRLLLCVLLAWVITNGWSYVLLAVGTYFEVEWMIVVSGAYLAFLWLPISPEKLVTLAIALGLLKVLFPEDQKTLAVLRQLHNNAKQRIKNRKRKKRMQEGEREVAAEEGKKTEQEVDCEE